MALIEGTNSYGNRSDADAYFNDSINSAAWGGFTNAEKDQGLVEATRVFERQSWNGEKEVSSQDLHFPATGLTDCSGNAITAARSLEIMQEAQYEYAFALLSDNSLLTKRDATGTNIKKVEASTAKVTYFRPSAGTRFPLSVAELTKCFLAGAGSSSVTGSYASGTSSTSSFTDLDSTYGLSKGLA